MSPEAQKDRAQQIVARYLKGDISTYELGQMFKVSGQRIRMILSKHVDPETRAKLRKLNEARKRGFFVPVGFTQGDNHEPG